MKTFQQIGTDIGELVQMKNAAYGSSFATAGAALRLLYPQGIAPEQLDDAQLLVRIWDKMMRIATDRDALGESPYGDISGYGILGVHMHQQKEGHETCNVAASAAELPSKVASSDSAKNNASARTPQSGDVKIEKPWNESSILQSSSGSGSTAALAPDVTVRASEDAVALVEKAEAHNWNGLCGQCDRTHRNSFELTRFVPKPLLFCSEECRTRMVWTLTDLLVEHTHA